MSRPDVSIVVPTLNGMATLPAMLDAIGHQRTSLRFETVAVDSGSSDGGPAFLRGRVDRLIEIPAGRFNHGLTRNLGVEAARGELIVLLVQDAIPSSSGWLDALVAPLIEDEQVAGAFGRQRPRAGGSALTRVYLARWIAASDVPRTVWLSDPAELERLDPMARLDRCAFDNVCSCIRRSVWAAHPFAATPIAEDLEWARDVLVAGCRLAYVPGAEVVHSHDRPARYELLRTYVLHRRLYELFGLRTIPSLPLLGRAIASSLALHLRTARGPDTLAMGRSIALAFAWPIGQYFGSLSAVRGWRPLSTRTV
jgi:rhamnosyltransferase